MTATGEVPARGRRYKARDAVEAARMYRGGWSKADLARRFDVSPSTIGRWVDPRVQRSKAKLADRHRAQRAAETGGAGLGRGHERPEFKLARMRALRDVAKLKPPQIARVMEFDFGDKMSAHTVVDSLARNRYPSKGR